jgi:thiol-disulfide isomerase/thioredoxin
MRRFMPLIVAVLSLTLLSAYAVADELDPKAAASDEEVYGKFAIGPKTSTPLTEAIAALNVQLVGYSVNGANADSAPTALPPLTTEDVLAAIRKWDRTKKPIADASYQIFAKIAENKTLPPHSLLQLDEQWLPRGEQELRLLQIKLSAMTGKNQGYEFVVREHELDRRPHFKPHPGYRWLWGPTARDPKLNGWHDAQLRVSVDSSDDQELVVEINRSSDLLGCQVVAYDEHLRPYPFDCHVVGAYNGFIRERHRLDYAILPSEAIAYVGIEGVTRQDLDELAQIAAKRIQEQGVTLLPLPRIGQAYDFSFTAAGKEIQSSQLRGKVVLIDLWASWCAPCLKKMPELKELYAKWHDEGLEIIGISFDDDAEAAQAVMDGMKLPWPSALLKPNSEAWKVWQQRDHVTSLPTVLVIDAEGILRYELFSNSSKVEEKIADLISQAKSTNAKPAGR